MSAAAVSERAAAMGYAGNALIRLAEERGDETLATALAHPGARVYLAAEGKWLCRGADTAPDPAFTTAEALAFGIDQAEAILLGWTADAQEPRLAAALPQAGGQPEEPAGAVFLDLRAMGVRRVLSADVEGQLAQGLHLLNWHRRSRFCGVCGSATVSQHGGARRTCTACGAQHFPRTDPVVIMLIRDAEGRCLLGRQHHFAPGMWSCLAGFVEPGETLENAVRRETREEAGVQVGRVAYHSSQPWPFPGSLMIGCVGEATSTVVTVQDSELEDCRWFSRADLATMIDGTHLQGFLVPPAYAIAHHLLRTAVHEEGDS